MKIDLGEYIITTDSLQFIVQQKVPIQVNNQTKEENIGKNRIVDIAYCPSLNSALNHLVDKVVLDNEDVNTIVSKLEELKAEIRLIRRRIADGEL